MEIGDPTKIKQENVGLKDSATDQMTEGGPLPKTYLDTLLAEESEAGQWLEMDSGLSETRRTVRKAFMNDRTGEVRNPVIGHKIPRKERLFINKEDPGDKGRMFDVKVMPADMTAPEIQDLKEKLDQEQERLANREPASGSTLVKEISEQVDYLLVRQAVLDNEVATGRQQVTRLEDQLVVEKFKSELSQEREDATKECLKQATRKTHELTRNHDREKTALKKNYQSMIDGMMQALPVGETRVGDGPAIRWAESVAEVTILREAWRAIFEATVRVHKQVRIELQCADFLLPGEWGRAEGLDRVRLSDYPGLHRQLLNNRWNKARENSRRLLCSLGSQGPILASLEGYPGEADEEKTARLEKTKSDAAWLDLAARTKFVLDTAELGKRRLNRIKISKGGKKGRKLLT